MKFNDFDFDKRLLQGIEDIGFTECMVVQEQTFAYIRAGKDVYAQSQTGTGKTAAFLVSGMQILLECKEETAQFLILAPTRELADQIEKEAKLLAKHLPFRIGSVYGGVSYDPQRKLIKEKADIIIATPGRLIDFHKAGEMVFDDIKVLVVDEADRMFDMGFIDDLRHILGGMPPKETRTTMLFSATLNSRVGNLTWEFMRETGEIYVKPENVTVEKIRQELYHVASKEKVKLLLGILKKEDPENAIIFVNTRDGAHRLTKILEGNGYSVRALMGNLPQSERLKTVKKLKEGSIRLVVATDVASRGLHIEDLQLVINYDLPDEEENYVHRIGRTARAGKSGKAVSLACERFVYNLSAIERFTNTKIPIVWFDPELLVEDKSPQRKSRGDYRGDRPRNDRERGRNKNRKGDRFKSGKSTAENKQGIPKPSERKKDLQKPSKRKTPSSRTKEKTVSTSAPRRNDRPKTNKTSPSSRDLKKPDRSESIEGRLVRYKKLYGDDFKVLPSEKPKQKGRTPQERPQKKGLASLIGKIFHK